MLKGASDGWHKPRMITGRRNMQKLEPPGLQAMKQFKLFKKWRKFITLEEDRLETCPKPLDDVMMAVKQMKKDRAEVRQKDKDVVAEENNTKKRKGKGNLNNKNKK